MCSLVLGSFLLLVVLSFIFCLNLKTIGHILIIKTKNMFSVCSCSIKFLHGSLKIVSAKIKVVLNF